MKADDMSDDSDTGHRMVFLALETLVVSAAITAFYLVQSHARIHESKWLNWYMTCGVLFAPIPLLVWSALLFRRHRHLFWLGLIPVLGSVVLLPLPA